MIYLVEDDAGIREMMTYTLNSTGFAAIAFPDAKPFWEAVENSVPELVLLDIMLPGEDGMEILKKLRAGVATHAVPVIMATAKGAEYDKITGLDQGADDYLVKPFGMMEMVSRVRAVLRRTAPKPPQQEYHAGSLSMSDAEHTVAVDGVRVALTLKEYEMLHLFLENPGWAFTRDSLLNRIWKTEYAGESRTVDVHVRTLRQKLGKCGDYIQTVRGIGYKLEVPPT